MADEVTVADYQFGTNDLIDVIMPLRDSVAPRFLLDIAFPGQVEQETEEIHFDRIAEDLRIAPFVSPQVPGRARAKRGFQVEIFKPAYVKPLDQLRPADLKKRLAGEPLGGAFSNAERALAHIGNLLGAHRIAIRRRLEVMAAEFFRTGKLTIAGEDYPTTVVDFGRKAGFTKLLTLTARWGETGVSPFDDVEAWLDEYAEENGGAATDVVMTGDAWALFKADPKTDKVLDRTRGQNAVIDLGFTREVPGAPVWKGEISGVNFWVYNDTYEDVDGTKKKLLPAHSVAILGTAVVDGIKCFGAIQDFEADVEALDVYAKTWVTKNPSVLNVLSQSAPLIVPRRANGVMFATVR